MSFIDHRFNFGYRLFMRIAEPRVVRLIHFFIYLCMLVAGLGVVLAPPASFRGEIGTVLVYIFGTFLLAGGAVSAFSVLPGIWWLERVGILSLWTGLAIYMVILSGLRPSPVSYSIAIAFILTFVLRWREIKGSQLAPREE